MSELNDSYIQLVAEGLEVHVPSVKGRLARDVVPGSMPTAWRIFQSVDGAIG
ncbi:hypothetical protein [Streptomyces sp. NPDC058297]|uniref:hypothetical protein n=1 Tax=Streptomyces sp. NPDC058297 TaxID=3346433 RepID=UPI0036EF5E12